jgi:hypothetical protein
MPATRSALRVLLVLAVIALAVLLLSRLNPRPSQPQPTATSAGGPTEAVTTPSPFFEPAILGMQVPPLAARGLRTVELSAAQLYGDPKPAWIMAVTTTRTQAIREARPAGTVLNRGPVVYLVVMKGNFADTGVGGTVGADFAFGHYVSAIFDPSTLTLLGTSVTSRAPAMPLSRLGPVLNLLAIP